MPRCDYCGGVIVFGGKKEGPFRFCNDKCKEKGVFLAHANKIPDALVREQAIEIMKGPCPDCSGNGPVEIHTSHRIYSFIILSTWSSTPQLCCKSCGSKNQFIEIIVSSLLGWWGIPWGIILTPIQIVRNIFGLLKFPDLSDDPSPALMKMTRLLLAEYLQQTGSDESTVAFPSVDKLPKPDTPISQIPSSSVPKVGEAQQLSLQDNPIKISILCPNCNTRYSVTKSRIPAKGAYAKCPRCQERLFISGTS